MCHYRKFFIVIIIFNLGVVSVEVYPLTPHYAFFILLRNTFVIYSILVNK